MKKLLVFSILAIISLGLSAQDSLQVDSLEQDTVILSPTELWKLGITNNLDSITRKVEKQNYSASYCVFDLTDDSIIYRYNADKKLKPASTQKLFTAATALKVLGPNYRFRTNVSIDGSFEEDSIGHRYLKGDICIKGGYDPSLQMEHIHYIAEKVATLGVDSIDGKIIVDNRIKLDIDHVKNEQKYFGENLYKDLLNAGIVFSSDTPYDTSSSPITTGWNLTTVYTPIDKVLNRMLKRSNNDFAECVLLNLCGLGRNDHWSYDNCKLRVSNLATEIGDSLSSYVIYDGSGLSHSNRCTSELLTKLLRYISLDNKIYPSIYDNLPIAGEDGTLAKRMKNGPSYNNVRAKTGTLSGVSTLAGYVTSSNGHKLAFAVMVNNLRSASNGKDLQNSICHILAK